MKNTFPIDPFKSFVKQLFTIEIEKCLNAKLINGDLIKGFFNLLSELEAKSKEDLSLVQKLLLKGENDSFTESFDFSLGSFYEIFSDYLAKSIRVNLESVHLEFLKEFLKTNKKYGPFKIFNFLKTFFTSLS